MIRVRFYLSLYFFRNTREWIAEPPVSVHDCKHTTQHGHSITSDSFGWQGMALPPSCILAVSIFTGWSWSPHHQLFSSCTIFQISYLLSPNPFIPRSFRSIMLSWYFLGSLFSSILMVWQKSSITFRIVSTQHLAWWPHFLSCIFCWLSHSSSKTSFHTLVSYFNHSVPLSMYLNYTLKLGSKYTIFAI